MEEQQVVSETVPNERLMGSFTNVVDDEGYGRKDSLVELSRILGVSFIVSVLLIVRLSVWLSVCGLRESSAGDEEMKE